MSMQDMSSQYNCQHQSVDAFLHHCSLGQYLGIFLFEGFDSVNSLLEITEEDMIFMNVKRGHRRLIQREIANVKGISCDQPVVANLMNSRYAQDLMELKASEPSRSSYNNSNGNLMITNGILPYKPKATDLTSPPSISNDIENGNNSSSGPMTPLLTRPYQPNPIRGHNSNSGTSDVADNSGRGQPATGLHIISNNPIIVYSNNNQNNGNNSARSNSISSNDDDDSIYTNESAPTTKRKYRRHAKPDRYAPIKPPSAYIMFSNDSRTKLKNRNLSFSELAKIVGDQWKNLNKVDKQNYERMAMRSKDEYLAALERYRQTPEYHRYQEYLNEFKTKQDSANRLIGRARKRAKQISPRSSFADSSSNGNYNGNGSSGSGSVDTYGDQESLIRYQRRNSGGQHQQSSLPEHQHQQDKQAVDELDPQAQEYHSDYQSDGTSAENDSIDQPKPSLQDRTHYPKQQNQEQRSSDSGYTSSRTSSSDSNGGKSLSQRHQWNRRSTQIMRGMLPVQFVYHIPPAERRTENALTNVVKESSAADMDNAKEGQMDGQMLISEVHQSKKRNTRINKSRST